MIAKLLRPVVVTAMNGPIVVVTLPAETIVEFDPFVDDDLTENDLTEVVCDGQFYLAMSQDLLTASQPAGLVEP